MGGTAQACSADWPAFRHNALRSGAQAVNPLLADPYAVKKLQVVWRFPATGSVGPFRASPVVNRDRVFIGSSDGRLYAVNAATGHLVWQYPVPPAPALTSQFLSNASSFGIAASAFLTSDRERQPMVVFAAPDQSIGARLGSGRLFALRASDGSEVWKSPELARLTGLTRSSTTELHEQFGYASPLVFNDRVFGGIANHGDNPIQRGRVVAVNLFDGSPVAGFSFEATATRGGGVWSALAGGLDGGALYLTTGNVRCWNGGCQSEPSPNHALSLLRLNANTGSIDWKLQPVPFDKDDDPDWATGAHLSASSCGHVAVSTMKDGWSYAARATSTASPAASVLWQFPPTELPFSPTTGTVHGDSRYLHAGAVWNDVFFTETGGIGIVDNARAGFGRLHALNICAGNGSRVRWTADIPGATLGSEYQLGNPSVTRGIVYIGTATGRLIALAEIPPSGRPRDHGAPGPTSPTPTAKPTATRWYPSRRSFATSAWCGRIRGEPALAGNRLFVATEGGVLFMLEPTP